MLFSIIFNIFCRSSQKRLNYACLRNNAEYSFTYLLMGRAVGSDQGSVRVEMVGSLEAYQSLCFTQTQGEPNTSALKGLKKNKAGGSEHSFMQTVRCFLGTGTSWASASWKTGLSERTSTHSELRSGGRRWSSEEAAGPVRVTLHRAATSVNKTNTWPSCCHVSIDKDVPKWPEIICRLFFSPGLSEPQERVGPNSRGSQIVSVTPTRVPGMVYANAPNTRKKPIVYFEGGGI